MWEKEKGQGRPQGFLAYKARIEYPFTETEKTMGQRGFGEWGEGENNRRLCLSKIEDIKLVIITK